MPDGVAPTAAGFTVGSGGGGGAGSVVGLFCRRSLGAPFSLFGFFFVAVSPLRPRGVACDFWSATSCVVAGAGVKATFCLTAVCFLAALSAASVLAREL